MSKWCRQNQILLFGFIIVLISFAIIRFGYSQIGGFDHSVMVDMGYRMFLGQRPYLDFISTTPIFFNLGSWFSVELFGVQFTSYVQFFALYTFAIGLWFLLLFRKNQVLNFDSALLLIAMLSATAVSVSYWWYNPVTTIAGLIFLASSYFICISWSKFNVLSFSASAVLLMGMKPHLAFMLLAGSFFILLRSLPRKFRTVRLAIICVVAFFILLGIFRVSPYDVIQSYFIVAGRASPSFDRFDSSFYGIISVALIFFLTVFGVFSVLNRSCGWVNRVFQVLILFAVYLAIQERSEWLLLVSILATAFLNIDFRKNAVEAKFVMLSLGVSYLAFFTNGEPKLTDLSFLILVPALITIRSKMISALYLQRTLLILVVSFGFYSGYTRYRVEACGWPFQSINNPIISSRTHFFENILAGPDLQKTLIEFEATLSKATAEKKTIWLGNRLEFLYAAYGMKSPIHQPIWIDLGVSITEQGEFELLSKMEISPPDIIVFPANAPDAISIGFRWWLRAHYSYPTGQELKIFTLRK